MTFPELNLPSQSFRIREHEGRQEILDVVRKKWLVLTPEEWVRQHIILFLNQNLGYPLSLLEVEKGLEFMGMKRRADVVVNNNQGQPVMLIECKAPHIKIDQSVFDQISRYNITYKVPFLLMTNGMQHFCCRVDIKQGSWKFMEDIPKWKEI